MLWIGANDAHHAFAVDHLAFVAHLFNRRPNFHVFSSNRTILPRPGSCGDNSTSTRSPGRTRTKFVFSAPAAWARTTASFSNFTFTIALGINSNTTATTFTAASKPTGHQPSPPRNARSGPTANDLSSPPSTCRTKPASQGRPRSPSARSPAPCLLSGADFRFADPHNWAPGALRAAWSRFHAPPSREPPKIRFPLRAALPFRKYQ